MSKEVADKLLDYVKSFMFEFERLKNEKRDFEKLYSENGRLRQELSDVRTPNPNEYMSLKQQVEDLTCRNTSLNLEVAQKIEERNKANFNYEISQSIRKELAEKLEKLRIGWNVLNAKNMEHDQLMLKRNEQLAHERNQSVKLESLTNDMRKEISHLALCLEQAMAERGIWKARAEKAEEWKAQYFKDDVVVIKKSKLEEYAELKKKVEDVTTLYNNACAMHKAFIVNNNNQHEIILQNNRVLAERIARAELKMNEQWSENQKLKEDSGSPLLMTEIKRLTDEVERLGKKKNGATKEITNLVIERDKLNNTIVELTSKLSAAHMPNRPLARIDFTSETIGVQRSLLNFYNLRTTAPFSESHTISYETTSGLATSIMDKLKYSILKMGAIRIEGVLNFLSK